MLYVLLKMPTTEIISVGSLEGPYTRSYKRIRHSCDSELNSHRDLFQDVLDRLVGNMIHIDSRLGNDDIEDNFMYFLGGDHYLDHENNTDEKYRFGYRDQTFVELFDLLSLMRSQSPTNHVIFLTDFQGGPETREIVDIPSIDSFKELNDLKGLRFNTLYSIGSPLEESKYYDYFND